MTAKTANERKQAFRERATEAGNCNRCGQNQRMPGRVRCQPCILEDRERRATQVVDMTLCTRCQKTKPSKGFKRCDACLEQDRTNAKIRRMRKRDELILMREVAHE